jgi:hypothetical protein
MKNPPFPPLEKGGFVLLVLCLSDGAQSAKL